jgi:hypothetical protein
MTRFYEPYETLTELRWRAASRYLRALAWAKREAERWYALPFSERADTPSGWKNNERMNAAIAIRERWARRHDFIVAIATKTAYYF